MTIALSETNSMTTLTETVGNLYYFGDPMCSWCWGFKPVLEQLDEEYPELQRKVVLGGLRPELDAQPMSEQQALRIQNAWQNIEALTKQPFNHDLWKQPYPAASTRNACLAVIAARLLDPSIEWHFMVGMFKAYYLDATDPTRKQTYLQVAQTLNLNVTRYQRILESDACETALEEDFSLARQFGVTGFPTLVLMIKKEGYQLSAGYQPIQQIREAIHAAFEHAGVPEYIRPQDGLYN